MGPVLRCRVEGDLAWLVLERPPRNELPDPAFADRDELLACLHTPGVKGAVLTGAGRHFSAGADLAALRRQAADLSPDAFRQRLERGHEILTLLAEAPVPLVAAIRGACLGAGLELALACHFRIAARSALLGLPEVEQGLVPGFGAAVWLRELLPRSACVQTLLRGAIFGAEEALEMGLIDAVVDGGELLPRVREHLAQLTAARSCEQIRAVLRAVAASRRLPCREALRLEADEFCRLAAAACRARPADA
jgi:enoyl-CoA hydratase/carnithine racemase